MDLQKVVAVATGGAPCRGGESQGWMPLSADLDIHEAALWQFMGCGGAGREQGNDGDGQQLAGRVTPQ